MPTAPGGFMDQGQINGPVRRNLELLKEFVTTSIAAAVALLGVAATHTPTWTQNATVTKTVNESGYTQIGKSVKGNTVMTATGAGTAANNVLVGLPVAMAATNGNTLVGSGWLFDASTGLFYFFELLRNTSTTCLLQRRNDAGGAVFLGTSGFVAAIASGDIVTYWYEYTAA